MAERSALIAGASGLVGSLCLRALLAEAHYHRVIAVVRRPLAVDYPRLTQCVVDFAHLDRIGLPEAETVYYALGTTIRKAGSREVFRRIDFGYTMHLARHAAETGTRQFVLVSSVAAAVDSPNFYLRVKAELEDALAALPFLSLHVFRPSFITGPRAERRLAEKAGIAIAQALQAALVGRLRKYRPVAATSIAAAMVAAARTGAPGRHVYHYDEILALAASGGTERNG
ncbi:MAG: NAD(P)H-binding protein [Bryobacteraceae bacterium]